MNACSVSRVSPSPTWLVSDANSASPIGTLATTAGASVGSSRSTTRTVAFGTIIAPQTATNSSIHLALSLPRAAEGGAEQNPGKPGDAGELRELDIGAAAGDRGDGVQEIDEVGAAAEGEELVHS